MLSSWKSSSISLPLGYCSSQQREVEEEIQRWLHRQCWSPAPFSSLFPSYRSVEECRKDLSWRCCTQMAAKHREHFLKLHQCHQAQKIKWFIVTILSNYLVKQINNNGVRERNDLPFNKPWKNLQEEHINIEKNTIQRKFWDISACQKPLPITLLIILILEGYLQILLSISIFIIFYIGTFFYYIVFRLLMSLLYLIYSEISNANLIQN